MAFSFDNFTAQVREAAQSAEPNETVRNLLSDIVADPAPIIAATQLDDEDEICLFEDQTVSIWVCRFQPGVVMPPHEHLLDVHIAGYAGGEKNILFQVEDGALTHRRTEIVNPGEVLTLGEDAVHAVSADGDAPSLALHVYMGPLMKLQRALFDWDTGEKIEFSMDNFYAMQKPAAELTSF